MSLVLIIVALGMVRLADLLSAKLKTNIVVISLCLGTLYFTSELALNRQIIWDEPYSAQHEYAFLSEVALNPDVEYQISTCESYQSGPDHDRMEVFKPRLALLILAMRGFRYTFHDCDALATMESPAGPRLYYRGVDCYRGIRGENVTGHCADQLESRILSAIAEKEILHRTFVADMIERYKIDKTYLKIGLYLLGEK